MEFYKFSRLLLYMNLCSLSWSLSNKTASGTANCESLRIEELSWNKFHKESKLQNFVLYLISSRLYLGARALFNGSLQRYTRLANRSTLNIDTRVHVAENVRKKIAHRNFPWYILLDESKFKITLTIVATYLGGQCDGNSCCWIYEVENAHLFHRDIYYL